MYLRSNHQIHSWMMLSVLLFVSVFSSVLHAYQPGKWYHMDAYIQKNNLTRPKKIEVIDSNGNVIKKASYEYNGNGQVVREIFFNESGKNEGESRFDYNNLGFITSETLYDKNENIINRLAYNYSGNKLTNIYVRDNTGAIIVEMQYTYNKGQLQGGQEIAGDDISRFVFDYVNDRLTSVIVKGDARTVLNKVDYRYNKNGFLEERVKTQGESRSLCKYEYSGDRLVAYSFWDMVDSDWKHVKTIELQY